MKLAKVTLRLGSMTLDEKIAFVEQLVESQTGNPDYSSGEVDLAELIALKDELIALRNARSAAFMAAQSKTETIDSKLVDFGKAANLVARDAEDMADFNADILESGGFHTFFPGKEGPVGPMPPVEGLTARPGLGDGEIIISWSTVRGNKGYVIYITTTPTDGDSWVKLDFTSITRITLSGLDTGTKYWLRVAAMGAADVGEGPASDPATSVAR